MIRGTVMNSLLSIFIFSLQMLSVQIGCPAYIIGKAILNSKQQLKEEYRISDRADMVNSLKQHRRAGTGGKERS